MIAKAMRLGAAGLMLLVAACGQKDASNTALSQAQAVVATPAKPSRDWSKVIVATPEGGYRMGNPNARVKFIEYASLTCPHCRDFHNESNAELTRMVAGGQVNYEFRNFVLNGPDLAVTLLAHCQSAPVFFKIEDALYSTQEQWIAGFTKMSADDGKRIGALPKDQQALALADMGKMDEFFRLRGMPRAKYEACLKDQSAVNAIQSQMDLAVKKYNLNGTPTFVFNEVTNPDVHSWPQVKAAIEAALRA